jgi:hypothetical protein
MSRSKKKLQPPLVPNLTCSKCGSNRIIQNAEIKPRDGGIPPSLSLEVLTGEKTMFGLGEKIEYAWVYANLCVDCRHIDLLVPEDDAEKLWKAYQDKNNGLK